MCDVQLVQKYRLWLAINIFLIDSMESSITFHSYISFLRLSRRTQKYFINSTVTNIMVSENRAVARGKHDHSQVVSSSWLVDLDQNFCFSAHSSIPSYDHQHFCPHSSVFCHDYQHFSWSTHSSVPYPFLKHFCFRAHSSVPCRAYKHFCWSTHFSVPYHDFQHFCWSTHSCVPYHDYQQFCWSTLSL